MKLRSFLFWLHLIAGLVAGLSIGIMCLTGTALAFEKELIAWSERDVRRIEPPPPGTPRLSLDQLQAKLREQYPDARPAGLVLQNDPLAAVAFTVGRSGGYYANPYTGEVRQASAGAMSDFMRVMTDWHRYLALTGEQRATGKWINGVSNLAFCLLAVSGLYLWLPRVWSWRSVRPILWFRPAASGKARDFNWHNVIGLWTAPVLIVLTLTAVPISFRWGGTVINFLAGAPASSPGGPRGEGRGPGGGPAVSVPAPAAGARALATEDLIAVVKIQVPTWQTITLRLGNGGPGGPEGRGGRGGAPGEARPPRAPAESRAAPTLSAASFTVRDAQSWPRTASLNLSLDPFTGAVLRRTGYADQPAAQQIRSWTRFLHTGEALGGIGQLAAGLACLGGCFLVYTGFALSWRRFFGRRAADRDSSLAGVLPSSTTDASTFAPPATADGAPALRRP